MALAVSRREEPVLRRPRFADAALFALPSYRAVVVGQGGGPAGAVTLSGGILADQAWRDGAEELANGREATTNDDEVGFYDAVVRSV